jgi:hypothetical protein
MVIGIETQYPDTSMRQLILVFACTAFATSVSAQTGEFQRNPTTVGVGLVIPVGKAAANLSTAPLLSVGSPYRFTRFLQSEAGFKVHPGLGQVQSGDRDYRIPFAGRYVMPSPLARIGFSAAAGGGHLHYSETVPSNGYYSPDCYTCLPQGAWGGYGLGNASYFFGHSQNFHVGTTFEFVAPSTDTQTVAYVPAVRATDGSSNLYLEIGLRF